MKKRYLIVAAAVAFQLSACDTTRQGADTEQPVTSQTTTTTTEPQQTPVGEVMENGGLKVYSFDDSPQFPEAALRMTQPQGYAEPGDVQFSYELTNYELTQQTQSEHAEHMANSHEGQHIHNIVDNEPYTAHYETNFTKKMEIGNHVVLSFLSRSYHESLKHKGAYDLKVVTVGSPEEQSDFDVNGQHMFYSRPKGEYKGKATEKIMLDFYLVNTDLSANGNKVKATINGNEFMLDRWLPYIIEGLPMGENTIKLELIDQDGKVVPGKFNTVERTITLKEA